MSTTAVNVETLPALCCDVKAGPELPWPCHTMHCCCGAGQCSTHAGDPELEAALCTQLLLRGSNIVTRLPPKLRAMLLVASRLVLCWPAWVSAVCPESLQAALQRGYTPACKCSTAAVHSGLPGHQQRANTPAGSNSLRLHTCMHMLWRGPPWSAWVAAGRRCPCRQHCVEPLTLPAGASAAVVHLGLPGSQQRAHHRGCPRVEGLLGLPGPGASVHTDGADGRQAAPLCA